MSDDAFEVQIILAEPSRLRQLNRHTGDGPGDTIGDCFRTCIACLLGCPDPSFVPHFVEETIRAGLDEHGGWEDIAAARRWLREHEQLDLAMVDISEAQRVGAAFLATVRSKAGPWNHSVVVDQAGLVWCPTTGDAGSYSVDDIIEPIATVLVLPYDPDPDELLAAWRSLAAVDG